MKPQDPQPEQQKTGLIEAEIQHNIPVKLHDSQIPKNPINSLAAEHDSKKAQEPDDKILQDVNRSVREPDNKPPKKSLFSFRKKKPSPKPESAKPEKAESSKPITVVIAALFAAVVLSVAAIYAFSTNKTGMTTPQANTNNTASTTNTSSSSAQNTKITSSELTKASSDLNSRIDSLNDAQDFNVNDFSDSSLGLQ
jgi:hypothetical protein